MEQMTLSWNHCRSFLGVWRTGSLSAAARTSGQTQPTVARHIALLEEALGGGPLFIRSPHGLAPTELASTLVPHALAMEASSAAMLRAASGSDGELAGAVRLMAGEVLSCEVLPSLLTEFRATYPQIDFELVLSDTTPDIQRSDADIAVRMVRPIQSGLITQRAGDIQRGMYAHPDYLARNGTPQTLTDLRGHAIIGFDRETAGIQGLLEYELSLRRDALALRTDDALVQLAAMRAGFGIGVCQTPLARRTPELVRLFPQEICFPLEAWVAMHEDLHSNPRMRLVFDHLVTALTAYAKESAGPD